MESTEQWGIQTPPPFFFSFFFNKWEFEVFVNGTLNLCLSMLGREMMKKELTEEEKGAMEEVAIGRLW